MRLEKYQVTQITRGRFRRATGFEKVVVAHLEQVGDAGITGDVTTQFAVGLVRTDDHGQRVPAHQRGEMFLDGQVPREGRLLVNVDGVHVGGVEVRGPRDLRLPCHLGQLVEYFSRALWASAFEQGQKCFAPLFGFGGVGVIDEVVHVTVGGVVGHGASLEVQR